MSLTREMAAYDEMRRSLEADHFGEWVIVHDELLAGAYADFESAAEDAVRRFGRGPYLIRQVGEGPVYPADIRAVRAGTRPGPTAAPTARTSR